MIEGGYSRGKHGQALNAVLGEAIEWLTEQSRTAKERRRHDGDPEGEVQSTE